MKSETPLDYAVFNLSPRRSRCELLVTSDGTTEKLASGLLKPFATHLKVAEEQVALAVQSIKLEADKCNNAQVWFTKGTLERFVRFVSTPEVLELVNTFDIEMSQLEAARKIYSQSAGDQLSNASGGDGMGSTAAADATKKELLRAIDVRLVALKQDLTTACARASAAGFNPQTVSGLQRFANHFGAGRLNEACSKSLAVWQRRPDLITWKAGVDDTAVRSSTGSDMSIDDPIGPESNVAQAQAQPQEQRQQTRSLNAQHSASASESDAEKQKQGDSQSPTESSSSSIQKAQPGRRLSVQDRINLFESKQKENSGGKPVVAKPAELRRLSSDVSSGPGPAVFLRRWSGASDMSIDVSGAEKKDTGESPLCTPSSSSSVSLPTSNIFPGSSEQKGLNREANSHAQNQLLKEDEAGSKGPANGEEQQGAGGTVERVEVNLHVASSEKLKISSGDVNRFGGIKDQSPPVIELKGFSDPVDVGVKNQDSSQAKTGSSVATTGDVEDTQQRHQRLSRHVKHPQSHFRSLSGQLDGGFGLKFQDKNNNGDSKPLPQPQWKSLTGVGEEARNKDSGSSEKQAAIAEDPGVQRMKLQKPTPGGPEQVKKYQGRREDSSSLSGSSKPGVPGTKVLENEDIFGTPIEQVQRVRQSKGNQEANDELKMKANELEKLFAEHKLRVPGDQSGSARRGKPADTHLEQQPISSEFRNPAAPEMSPVHMLDRNTMVEPSGSSSNMNFKTPPMKMLDNHDYGGIARSNSAGPGFAFDSRGKFYERYMQKRNAKLKEEWGSNRVEKEAKMKAMRDNLEQSKNELKAKFSEGDNSVSSARRRAEKLRSFNARSSWKREQLIDSMRSEEDDDLSEFLDQKSYGQDRFNETFFSDGGSRSSSKKSFLPRNMSSSTPRTTAPIPRSNVKPSNSGSGRRKMQVENPLAQSVPNFSDIRKENTKPFSGVGKMTTRSQVRNYSRSKSATEDIPLVKEEKTRRHQSVRKGLANPLEFKDGSPMISDDLAVGQLKEQTEPVPYDTFSRHVNSKPFLRKGTGGAGGSISKLKASMASEMREEEEFDELPFDAENSGGIVTEEEEEDLENAAAEDYDDMDNGKPSQESDKSGNSGSENGDSVRSLSQVDPASVPELPAPVPSTFHHMGSLQDSPGESPISWNSRMHHPFSYQRETSDIDASVDSPMGSPASWNSHSLAQTDADVARMRKKWGSAQKPILVSNSSHNQSRKDMTKGFKRLLKFGRKKSGTDSMVDWISATTSEGDDDTEDGRDPANRLSDDLRKSRMGFSQGHPSDDGFNDSELFNEQVQDLHSSIPAPPANFRLREDHISGSSLKAPRSFFSLSSFRSKGSDSKPR